MTGGYETILSQNFNKDTIFWLMYSTAGSTKKYTIIVFKYKHKKRPGLIYGSGLCGECLIDANQTPELHKNSALIAQLSDLKRPIPYGSVCT